MLAGAAMLLFFLYLRFPGDAAKNYLKAFATEHFPNLMIVMDAVKPSVPPGIAIQNLTAAFRGRPEATIHADRLVITPGWLSLLRGRFSFLVKASGYEGRLSGKSESLRAFSVKGPYLATVEFDGIRLDKCLWLQDFFPHQLSGILKGSFSFNGTPGTLKTSSGKLDAAIANGGFQLSGFLWGFDKISFSRTDLKMELKNGALRISGLTLTGDKMRITLKGNILVADDFKMSRMDLSGSAEIQGLGGRRIPITIGGEFGNPTIKTM
jgi:type II secretion system protein N